jgi:hypothetical protein
LGAWGQDTLSLIFISEKVTETWFCLVLIVVFVAFNDDLRRRTLSQEPCKRAFFENNKRAKCLENVLDIGFRASRVFPVFSLYLGALKKDKLSLIFDQKR